MVNKVKIKKKKGITLIELVITMAILGIIIATATVAFTANSNILSKVDMKSELQLDGQMIQEQLSTVALECSGVVTYEQNRLVLQDSLTESNVHAFELSGDSLVYKVNEVQQDEADIVLKEKKLSTHVSGMNIEVDGTSMKYRVELSMRSGKNTEELVVENRIVFRNSN